MDNYISVINGILELSHSIGEAIDYMQYNLEVGENGVIDIVLNDTIDAMKSISKAIKGNGATSRQAKEGNLTTGELKELNVRLNDLAAQVRALDSESRRTEDEKIL